MKPVSTTVTELGVHFRLADHADSAKATEWIDIQVKSGDLRQHSGAVIPQAELQYLSELQIAAPGHSLQLIRAEIQRLRNMGDAVH